MVKNFSQISPIRIHHLISQFRPYTSFNHSSEANPSREVGNVLQTIKIQLLKILVIDINSIILDKGNKSRPTLRYIIENKKYFNTVIDSIRKFHCDEDRHEYIPKFYSADLKELPANTNDEEYFQQKIARLKSRNEEVVINNIEKINEAREKLNKILNTESAKLLGTARNKVIAHVEIN